MGRRRTSAIAADRSAGARLAQALIGRRGFVAGLAALPVAGRAAVPAGEAAVPAGEIGSILRLDPALDAVVDADSPIEVIGSGYTWAEGPVWVKAGPAGDSGGFLLFSDPPNNIVHRWKPGGVPERFLHPSGHALPVPAGIREPGVNGMAPDGRGQLVLADSGNRLVARLDPATGTRSTLVERFEGKRFNSPNDVAVAADGAIWFTDPPYGLADAEQSPLRELDFNGVYRLGADGRLTLVDRSRHRPNGIALSPDGRSLYLALSDEARPQILVYRLGADGLPVAAAALFHDAGPQARQGLAGLPDGMKVDREGRVYATAPGGVHVLTPEGRLIGILSTGGPVSNCAFGEDGRTLFLTSQRIVARVRLKASGW